MGIQNAQLFEASVLEYKKNQLLLSLAKSLFQEQSSLDRLITTIIREAKDMLKCERCTIFLLDLKMYDQVGRTIFPFKEFFSQSNNDLVLPGEKLHNRIQHLSLTNLISSSQGDAVCVFHVQCTPSYRSHITSHCLKIPLSLAFASPEDPA